MEHITESRIIPIYLKVFQPENIKELAVLIWDETEVLKKEHIPTISRINKKGEIIEEPDCTITYKIICFDNTVFTSGNYSLFDNDSLGAKKRVKSITMELKSTEYNIEIQLHHGSEGDSLYTVSANDNLWVNGIQGKITNLLNSYKGQDIFVHKRPTLSSWILFISSVFFTLLCLDILIQFDDPSNKSIFLHIAYLLIGKSADPGQIIAWIIVVFMLSFVFWAAVKQTLFAYIQNIWPFIEIQIGPEHLQIEKRKRKAQFFIWTTLIIPIVLTIIFRFI